MGLIHKPYPAQQKPPLGSQINWGHPLSQGLVGAWLMNEGGGNKINDLTGLLGLKSTNATFGNFGNVSGFKSVGNDVGLVTPAMARQKNPEATIIWSGVILGNRGTNGASLLGVTHNLSDTNPYVSIDMSIGGGTVNKVAVNINLNGTFINTANPVIGAGLSDINITQLQKFCIAITIKNGDQRSYKNGVLQEIKSRTDGVITYNSDAQVHIGRYLSNTRDSNSITEYAYLFGRVLSPSEIQSLYQAPYQMIVVPRIYVTDVGTTTTTSSTTTTTLSTSTTTTLSTSTTTTTLSTSTTTTTLSTSTTTTTLSTSTTTTTLSTSTTTTTLSTSTTTTTLSTSTTTTTLSTSTTTTTLSTSTTTTTESTSTTTTLSTSTTTTTLSTSTTTTTTLSTSTTSTSTTTTSTTTTVTTGRTFFIFNEGGSDALDMYVHGTLVERNT